MRGSTFLAAVLIIAGLVLIVSAARGRAKQVLQTVTK